MRQVKLAAAKGASPGTAGGLFAGALDARVEPGFVLVADGRDLVQGSVHPVGNSGQNERQTRRLANRCLLHGYWTALPMPAHFLREKQPVLVKNVHKLPARVLILDTRHPLNIAGSLHCGLQPARPGQHQKYA